MLLSHPSIVYQRYVCSFIRKSDVTAPSLRHTHTYMCVSIYHNHRDDYHCMPCSHTHTHPHSCNQVSMRTALTAWFMDAQPREFPGGKRILLKCGGCKNFSSEDDACMRPGSEWLPTMTIAQRCRPEFCLIGPEEVGACTATACQNDQSECFLHMLRPRMITNTQLSTQW